MPERNEPSTTAEEPRYASVQDYLRVLRRRRKLILIVTIVVALAAFGRALLEEPVYQTSAELLFRDPFQDVQIVAGRNALPERNNAQRAALNAQLATSAEVAERVAKRLDTGEGPGQLQAHVTSRVGLQTQLVELEAQAESGERAARIANAFAREARAVSTQEAVDRIDAVADQIEEQLEDVRGRLPELSGRVQSLSIQLAQLRTLAKISEPVEIAEPAGVPGRPISPNPARSAGLGLLVGLVLGLLAAFIRDALDRRLHNAHEVHRELELPVVGRVSHTAFAYAGLAANGTSPMTESDFEAFRVLRTNLAYLGEDRGLRTILVTSGLAQEGKSTVSIALASAAALAGHRVLLVECDLRRPSFERRLGVSREPGLSDYLTGRASPQEILRTVPLYEPLRVNGGDHAGDDEDHQAGTLVCITAGSAVTTAAELLSTDRFRGFLDKAGRAYDLVVLDGSPLLSVADPMTVLSSVDAVLLCVRVQQTTREEARATRHALEQVGDLPMGAVVTGIRRGGPDAYDYYYGY